MASQFGLDGAGGRLIQGREEAVSGAIWKPPRGLLLAVMLLTACAARENNFTPPVAMTGAGNEPPPMVLVELLRGPALPMARLLSKAVARGLIDQGVTATVAPDVTATAAAATAYVLNGRVEAGRGGTGAPFVKLIYWTLRDRAGRLVGAYTQGVRGKRWKWHYGDPGIIRAVGSGAAKSLSSMIAEEKKTTLPFLPAEAKILVRPVVGAPGDGNLMLTNAILAALGAADLMVTGDRRQAGIALAGTVDARPQADGRIRVRIAWRVSTIGGVEIGRAIQDNTVAAAGLAESWRAVAPKIAAAALRGIESIIKSAAPRSSPNF